MRGFKLIRNEFRPISGLYKRYRIIVLGLVVVLTILILLPYLRNVKLQYYDFNVFWYASRHTLEKINPYTSDWFLYPPWVIPPFFPFGLLPFDISRLLWYIVEVVLIMLLSDKLWTFYQGQFRYRWMAWLISLSFSPTMLALIWGQLSPLILMGIYFFLKYCEQARQDGHKLIWAGVNAYWLALKPQLMFLLFPAWILWLARKKAWWALGASFIGIIGATLAVSLFVPDILQSYLNSFLKEQPALFGTPTLGFYLRLIFGEERFWLQFIPPFLGIAWLLYYWVKKRDSWQWKDELPVLIFVTLLTTPHGWTHDYLILLPVILWGFIKISNRWTLPQLILCIFLWVILNAGVLLSHFWLSDFWFYWQVPILLGMMLLLRNQSQRVITPAC